MFKPNRFFIAYRYSQSRQRSGFVSFITFFSVAGISLGVLALILVISVMNGFESELKKRILGVIPHMVVSFTQTTEQQLHQKLADSSTELNIKGLTPYIQSSGLVQSQTHMQAISVQGIEVQSAKDLSIVASHMQYGRFDSLQAGGYNLLLGQQLASRMDVRVGDKVRIMLAEKSIYTPMGRMPVQRKFTVSGIFDAGSDVDANVVLINVFDLQRLLRIPAGPANSYRIYLNNAFELDTVASYLQQHFADADIVDWRETQGELFEAVKMEKNIMWMMLALIIAVATFNIVSALVMVVNDKKGEIASLKTMGMSEYDIVLLFVFQGMYKGCGGALIGTILGLTLCYFLNPLLAILGIQVFANPAYAMQGLPVDIHYQQVVAIAFTAILMSFTATIYPAYRAANTNPAEILKHE
ncbi:lipoprotein-releasing ABC transporter permease subunit [Catenovulum sediminis]|uniref:Lipoprotein-releasing ABC transporter permease subunit n=1 Tax=Catenovulum sediminis TaxID=1740262 RepID=A0ABV1RKS8_9ALTE